MCTAWGAQGLRQGCSAVHRPLAAPLPLRARPSSSAHRLTTRATERDPACASYSCERILRYPDGRERRIIYPQEAVTDEEDDGSAMDVGWDICFGLKQQSPGAKKRQRPTTYKRVNGPSARSNSQAMLVPAQPQRADSTSEVSSSSHMAKEDERTGDTISTASAASGRGVAAFLDSLFAAAMETSQPEVDVEGCYEVLQGCPWVLPRPVFVLAHGRRDSELGGAVTLRVRVEQDAADELAQVLKNVALSKRLSVSAMKDGVVAFQRVEDADLYATLLAEEGTSDVRVAEVDSHALFRMTSDVQALVVLLRPSERMPHHYQLAATLKQQKAWDEL